MSSAVQAKITAITATVKNFREIGLTLYPIEIKKNTLVTVDSAGNVYHLAALESGDIAQFLAAAGNRWLADQVELRETLLMLQNIAALTAPDEDGEYWPIFPGGVEAIHKLVSTLLERTSSFTRRSDLSAFLHSMDTTEIPHE